MDWTTLLRSFGSVFVILLLVAVGVFVERRRWFEGENWRPLGTLVVNVAMPAAAFYYITSGFTRDDLAGAALSMLGYGGVILASSLVAWGLAHLIRLPQGRRGVFIATCAFSNSVFIGVPMTAMLFGEAAVKYAFMAYLPNTLLFWTLAAQGIRRDVDPHAAVFQKGWLGKLFPPALVATILALVVVWFGIPVPTILTQATDVLGGMVSPAALIYCGMLLSSAGFANMKPDRSHIAVLAVRFVLSPLAAFFVLRLVGAPQLLSHVLVAQAAMPAMSNITMLAGLYGADDRYAATGFLVTTVLSFVFIPIVMVALTMAG